MKPRKWASSQVKNSSIVLRWFLYTILALWSSLVLATPARDVISVRQAQFIISDSATIPVNDAGWQSVALPHRVPKPTNRDLVPYWYKANITLSNTTQPLWLYLSMLPSGGAIFVNGSQIGDIPGADRLIQVRWHRPHLLFLPPLSLHEGQNEISVRFAIREQLTSFGEIEIGPEKPLREKFEQLFFWEDSTAEISAAICLLAGVLIIVFWFRRPQEKLYGLFGVCVLFWGLRTFLLRLPMVPMEYLTPWRVAYYFTTSGFIVLITIFMLRFSGCVKPYFSRILIAYWLIGCIVFSLVGMPLRPFMNSFWLPGFLPFTLYSVFQLCAFAMRHRTQSSLAMGLAVVIALGLSIHDLIVQEGWFNLPEIYLMHLGIPAFLLVMTGLLSDRFLDSLKKVESINEQLALRVSEREQELVASHNQLRKFEHDHATTEERQRIMQDMHDGVGSQLLSTLIMVQRGATTQNDTVALLQDCLDDMRLAIDSLSPTDSDLLPALGNFRFRMESRFKGMGLALQWRNHDMPDSFEFAPHAGLHVLRILQEALANILKHAQAKNVMVELNFSPGSLHIQVTDDGIGFVVVGKSTGRGLSNMQSRARKIGASFNIEHLSPGTVIRLYIPIETGIESALPA